MDQSQRQKLDPIQFFKETNPPLSIKKRKEQAKKRHEDQAKAITEATKPEQVKENANENLNEDDDFFDDMEENQAHAAEQQQIFAQFFAKKVKQIENSNKLTPEVNPQWKVKADA